MFHLQISVVAWFIRRICPINWATTFLNFALSFCFLIFEFCFSSDCHATLAMTGEVDSQWCPFVTLSGSEGSRNDTPFVIARHAPFFVIARSIGDEAIPRSNPKLKALNSKQILISKFKTQNPFGHLILFSISDLVFRILFFGIATLRSQWQGKKARNDKGKRLAMTLPPVIARHGVPKQSPGQILNSDQYQKSKIKNQRSKIKMTN